MLLGGGLAGCASSGLPPRPGPAEVTVRCPVSETDTNPQLAQTTQYGGKTYYFCCKGCKEAFEKEPERYVTP